VSDVDEIRRQMAQIRHDMHYDVSNVVSEVEEVMDWRSPLRKHPYMAISVGLAVGYFLVPKRSPRIELAASNVQPLLDASTLAQARPEKPPKSLARKATGWTLGLVWPLVSQSVQAYAAVWLENQLKQHLNLHPHPAAPDNDASASSTGRTEESYGGEAVYRMPKRG
jgi:hypothetical protein